MTKIRHASLNDLEKLSEVESLCFPPAEACILLTNKFFC